LGEGVSGMAIVKADMFELVGLNERREKERWKNGLP
jgi:hypothetical protein